VESALGQTLDDVEVVVVDDGSDPPLAVAPWPRLRCVRRD
jgi:glycosyltransferase involved in cell wall biosynthesis